MRSQRKLKLKQSSILLCHLLLLCLIPTFVRGACTSSDQCGNPNAPICNGGTCQACTSPTECSTEVPGTASCNSGACVAACTTSAGCTHPKYAVCYVGVCTGCGLQSECTANPNFGAGSTCSGTCGTPCTANTDCTNRYTSNCETFNHQCGVCMSDDQCSHISLTPYCLGMTACVECTLNSHCASGTCNNYKCVCSSNSQCTDATLSRCYHDVCQSCAADSDCTHISGKPSCVSGTCQVESASSSSSSSGDITDGDIIIGAVFGSIAGVVVVAIVVFKILSWQKQRKARLSNPHQKVKTISINTQSPNDLSTPVHSESAPINQEIDIKPSI